MLKMFITIGLILGFSATAEESSWVEKFKMSGDLRFRHDYEKRDNIPARHRERYRLRVATGVKINEKMNAKFRLASADNGGDPISTNSTMNNNGSKKSIYIDQATLNWKFSDTCSLDLGKMENPMRPLAGSQLVFDSDYTPEGFSTETKMGSLFAKLGGFSLAERNGVNAAPDAYLVSGLLGMKSDVGFMVGAGYHEFTAIKENPALISANANDFQGNSSRTYSGAARYTEAYRVAEIYGEYQMKMASGKASIFVDGILNTAMEFDEDNTGVLAGLTYAALTDDGKPNWNVGYNYRAISKNATVSALNDSDFASGVDGAFGHNITVGMAVMDNANVSLNYFIANVDNNGTPYKTDRGLLDLQVNF